MIARGTLGKYLKAGAVFIETGTREGHTVALALELGASKAWSVENQVHLHEAAVQRFKSDPRVEIHLGTSPEFLGRILPKLTEPALFWLDAHTTGKPSPILDELEELAKNARQRGGNILRHILLIDDLRCYRRSEWAVSMPQVVEAVLKVNPEYHLGVEDGYAAWDILVARTF